MAMVMAPTGYASPHVSLHVVGLDTVGYDKVNWAFKVEVRCFDSLCPELDWHVRIAAQNGHGQLDESILEKECDLTVPVIGGVANVKELQFCKLSSKNGGFFRLHLSLVCGSGAPVATAISEKITIKCLRMRCDEKIGHDSLSPDDPLNRMPKIGKGYATKFADHGIHTVADLAKINLSTEGLPYLKALLKSIRANRGSLTMPKLKEHIRAAKAAMRRCDQASASDSPSPTATDSGYAALARLAEADSGAIPLPVQAATSGCMPQPRCGGAVSMDTVVGDLAGKDVLSAMPVDKPGPSTVVVGHKEAVVCCMTAGQHDGQQEEQSLNSNTPTAHPFDETLFSMINENYFDDCDMSAHDNWNTPSAAADGWTLTTDSLTTDYGAELSSSSLSRCGDMI